MGSLKYIIFEEVSSVYYGKIPTFFHNMSKKIFPRNIYLNDSLKPLKKIKIFSKIEEKQFWIKLLDQFPEKKLHQNKNKNPKFPLKFLQKRFKDSQ